MVSPAAIGSTLGKLQAISRVIDVNDSSDMKANPLRRACRRRILDLLSGFTRVSNAIETRGRDPCPPGPAPRGLRYFSPERPTRDLLPKRSDVSFARSR